MKPEKPAPSGYLFYSAYDGYDVFVSWPEVRLMIAKADRNRAKKSKDGPVLVRIRKQDHRGA